MCMCRSFSTPAYRTFNWIHFLPVCFSFPTPHLASTLNAISIVIIFVLFLDHKRKKNDFFPLRNWIFVSVVLYLSHNLWKNVSIWHAAWKSNEMEIQMKQKKRKKKTITTSIVSAPIDGNVNMYNNIAYAKRRMSRKLNKKKKWSCSYWLTNKSKI